MCREIKWLLRRVSPDATSLTRDVMEVAGCGSVGMLVNALKGAHSLGFDSGFDLESLQRIIDSCAICIRDKEGEAERKERCKTPEGLHQVRLENQAAAEAYTRAREILRNI